MSGARERGAKGERGGVGKTAVVEAGENKTRLEV
jgi:hypothetical protein